MSHIYISKDVVNPNHVTIDNAYTLFQYTITKTQSFDYTMKTHITEETLILADMWPLMFQICSSKKYMNFFKRYRPLSWFDRSCLL